MKRQAARLAPGEVSVMAERCAEVDRFAAMVESGMRPDGSPIAAMPFEACRS